MSASACAHSGVHGLSFTVPGVMVTQANAATSTAAPFGGRGRHRRRRRRAKKAVGRLTNDNADVQAGINIVLNASRGADPPDRREFRQRFDRDRQDPRNKSETYGFDAQNEECVDMIDQGIVDPAKVVRTALQDAASIAGPLVTIEAIIAEVPNDKPAMPMGGGGLGGHGRNGFPARLTKVQGGKRPHVAALFLLLDLRLLFLVVA
jgi:hypothetical protein